MMMVMQLWLCREKMLIKHKRRLWSRQQKGTQYGDENRFELGMALCFHRQEGDWVVGYKWVVVLLVLEHAMIHGKNQGWVSMGLASEKIYREKNTKLSQSRVMTIIIQKNCDSFGDKKKTLK